MMTLKDPTHSMVGQGDAAVGALKGPTAIATENEICESSAVEEKKALKPPLRILDKSLPQPF
jgi:hypothetical protein